MKMRDIIDVATPEPLVLDRGTRVVATQSVGEITKGDTGSVRAAWVRANVAVLWDNGKLMSIHRKRLAIEPGT